MDARIYSMRKILPFIRSLRGNHLSGWGSLMLLFLTNHLCVAQEEHSPLQPDQGPQLIYKPAQSYTIEDESTFPHYTNVKRSSLPYDNFNQKVLYMERTKQSTLLTVISHVPLDWTWYQFSHNDMIVDSKTGNQYKLRGLKGGLPVDTCFFIRHQQGEVVEFTLIFPPLPKSVKTINYIQIPSETRINSVESTRLYNLNVKELLQKEKIYRPRPDGKIIE